MTATAEDRERPQISFWNDPKVRSILFQIILLLVLAFMAYEIVVNTMSNLKSRNIASGFGFLSKTSGFDIIQSLIPYSSASTYGRAILVGFYNTLLVSGLSIVAATIIGFIMGVARLSKNWLIARIGTFYVEIFRNIPLLLWIFIFYSAVLQPLPGPREALNFFDMLFLSNRGFMMPKPIFGAGSMLGFAGLALGVILAIVIARWSKARQMATGQTFPVLWTSLALILGLPLLGFAVAGFPLHWEFPELKGFNFAGGIDVIPELIAMFLALSIYTGTYVASGSWSSPRPCG
jgi:general L-amino acid transport system permease protein